MTTPRRSRPRVSRVAAIFLLAVGAAAFVFPFYYMYIGSLQTKNNSSLSGVIPQPGNISLDNYTALASDIDIVRGLLNSLIFAGGVVACTVVFGLLTGYALARMQWRGRGFAFATVLLVQVIPFQLLTIPLYVMVTRQFGLADSFIGMILPGAINATAVIVFRQYFMQLPEELFDAARIDGASEVRILLLVAVPLIRPAIAAVVLITFIGPWNEFLWPFLITKDQELLPFAVSLAHYIDNATMTSPNPIGAMLAGASVLATPVLVLFIAMQRFFVASDLGSGLKG